MKTEQEQIEKMARSMCGYCSTDGKCAVSKNLREPDICANVDTEHCLYRQYAERLIENAYGKVSEYEAEIERLKAENETYCKQINQAYDTGYNDGYDSCQDDIKRAKIDVLNEVKERAIGLAAIETYHICNLIDELIKEVQDE